MRAQPYTTPNRCSNLRQVTTWCRLRPEMARLWQHFRLYGLLLALLSDQRLVNVRDHTCTETKITFMNILSLFHIVKIVPLSDYYSFKSIKSILFTVNTAQQVLDLSQKYYTSYTFLYCTQHHWWNPTSITLKKMAVLIFTLRKCDELNKTYLLQQ